MKIRNKYLFIIPAFIAIGLLTAIFLIPQKPSDELFAAPGRDYPSEKKVEDYFIERLRMTPQEASEIRSKQGVDGTVDLRINTNVTLDAEYRISEDMTAWEIADILLNKASGHFSYDEYGYFFMP